MGEDSKNTRRIADKKRELEGGVKDSGAQWCAWTSSILEKRRIGPTESALRRHEECVGGAGRVGVVGIADKANS